jgi:hypothetical protein
MNTNPQVGGVLGTGPTAYRLLANSPATDRGRGVTDALAGMGLQDFYGNTIAAGPGYDIGAAEFRVGTDPASPSITTVQQQNGILRVMFTGLPGRIYSVEGSGDLRAWTRPLQVLEQSPGLYIAEERASQPFRFYRSRVRSLAR